MLSENLKRNLKKTFIFQQDQADCGVACLLSVIRFYGGDDTIENLRNISGTNSEGTTMLGLYHAAIKLNLEVDAFQADSILRLDEITTPVLLHVTINEKLLHFIVLYGKSGQKYIIGDPAIGIIELDKYELEKIWVNKVLLTLNPTMHFSPKSVVRLSIWKWLYKYSEEDFNILVLASFIGILISILNLSTAICMQHLIDNILPHKIYVELFLSMSLLYVLFVAKSFISFLREKIMLIQYKDFNERITLNFFNKLLNLPKVFFSSCIIAQTG